MQRAMEDDCFFIFDRVPLTALRSDNQRSKRTRMARVLVVDDEKRLLRTIREGLTEEGYETVTSTNGEAALFVVESQTIDLVILDLMLPGLHGLEVLRRMRTGGFSQPVLILTACDRVPDRVAGLDNGADDYLVKPFSYAELLARVRVLLRRGPPRELLELLVDDLRLDLLHRRVFRGPDELELSRREFEVLECLARHQGQTVSREMLARDIWRDPQTLLTNVIDVFVNRLRRKVDRQDGPSYIQTVRGTGYTISAREP